MVRMFIELRVASPLAMIAVCQDIVDLRFCFLLLVVVGN